jgi:Tol biopolymer transport system component
MRPGKVGEYDLWTVRPSGKGLRRLTTAPARRSDYNPTWSPNGSSVLFERRVLDGKGENLYLVDAASRHLRVLTHCSTSSTCWSDNEATWSPRGRKIAFSRATGRRSADGPAKVAIYVANADGSAVDRLSKPHAGREDHYPTWSPDGDTIIFQRDPATKLVAIDVATRAERVIYRLPSWAQGGGAPKFSPNGRKILFSFWCIYGDSCPASTRSSRNAKLATIDRNGRHLHAVPLPVGADSGVWSPNGRELVLRCHAGLDFRLCIATAGGKHLKRFPWRVDSAHPDWGTRR